MFVNADELIALADQVPHKVTRHLTVVGAKKQGGRNEKLKSMVAASLDAGDLLNVILGKIIRYDQEHHNPPLFTDESESQMRGNDAQSNAIRFVSSVTSSINNERLAEGLPPQNFRLIEFEPCPSRQEGSRIFISAAQLLENLTPPVYIIDGLIEKDTDAMLFGPSGGGKTFVALDIGSAVATEGETLQGRKCEQGIVLYLAGEGHGGIRRRLHAWAQHNGKTRDDLKYLHISKTTVGFDGSGLDDVVIEAKQFEQDQGMPVKLIIIDTLARHMIGDENSASDAGKYIQSLGKLRQSFVGCSTLTVHHTGHGQETKGRGRGSSAIPAAMDCIVNCDKGSLSFTKLKDGEIPSPFEFKLMPIELLTDDLHDPFTSCYVEYGAKAAKNRFAGLGDNEMLIVKILEKTEMGMSKSDLRNVFFETKRSVDPEVKTPALKMACTRALEKLRQKMLIILDHDQYMLPSQLRQSVTSNIV